MDDFRADYLVLENQFGWKPYDLTSEVISLGEDPTKIHFIKSAKFLTTFKTFILFILYIQFSLPQPKKLYLIIDGDYPKLFNMQSLIELR